jgi:hypothetical protein
MVVPSSVVYCTADANLTSSGGNLNGASGNTSGTNFLRIQVTDGRRLILVVQLLMLEEIKAVIMVVEVLE